jgi:hypothetical protein
VWGEDERIEWLRAYLIKGKALRQRWGVQDVDDNRDYNFRDYYDLENRCVWITELDAPIIEPQQYDMPDIPGFSAMADGTLLFTEEARKRQPFLYAMLQSGLAKREDELLTVLFTSVYSRGVGPLALIDPDTLPTGGVQVNYQGLFRYITAKGIFADDKAYDANLLQLQGLIQQLNQQSTINSQTLGENISPGTPYSGYAMASQNGRIPIVPIQEACEKVIHDAAIFALRYYKQRNLNWKNAKGEELRAIDIPDVFKLTVKLEVDLPQDQFRMAQIASQLSATGYVSMEWVRNLLQIHDSRKMDFDIMAEKAMLAAFQQDLPNLVGQMLQAVGGTPTQPPPNTEYLGEVPRPEGEWRRGSGSQLGYHQMPDGSMMADSEMQGQNAMIPGGPDAAMAGGGSIPATEQLSPEQMNGGVAR